MSLFAQKFAHINSQLIIQAMPEYATAQAEIETLQNQYKEELKRIQDEFQTKYEDYQKNGASLPEAAKQRREQELKDLDQHLQQYYQTSEADLQKQGNEKLAAITEKVAKAINEVGTSGGYVYVMDLTSGIPFINETLSTDVTEQVKSKLGIK